jgi:hypothetical protein
MDTHNLDGETALYQSFKHSQGNVDLQAELLALIKANYNVSPDFYLSNTALQRYRRFLNASRASKSRTHVAISPHDSNIKNTVRQAYDAYRGFLAINQNIEPALRLARFTLNLVDLEASRLGANMWHDRRRQVRANRLQRLQARLEAGTLSFLYFYGGYDGTQPHSTGYIQLDQLYQSMAEFYKKNDTDMHIQNHRQRLAAAPSRIQQILDGHRISDNPKA